ncbi:MAG TPA: chromate transporter [Atopostipes sp.]|nr:chromate transporter [Atopostipes sp.]
MDRKIDLKLLWKLFLSTLYLSAFTFGGGYVIVTLMKSKFVDEYKWITEKEMLNITAIAQSAPGAIAVNAAIVVGFRLAGFIGVLVAVLGTIIPPFIIISLISLFYEVFRQNQMITLLLGGMEAGVAAVVVAVSVEMAFGVVKDKDTILTIMMVVAFIANAVFNVSVIIIILISVLIGIALHLLFQKGEVTE